MEAVYQDLTSKAYGPALLSEYEDKFQKLWEEMKTQLHSDIDKEALLGKVKDLAANCFLDYMDLQNKTDKTTHREACEMALRSVRSLLQIFVNEDEKADNDGPEQEIKSPLPNIEEAADDEEDHEDGDGDERVEDGDGDGGENDDDVGVVNQSCASLVAAFAGLQLKDANTRACMVNVTRLEDKSFPGPPFRCRICRGTSTRRYDLKRHLLKLHIKKGSS